MNQRNILLIVLFLVLSLGISNVLIPNDCGELKINELTDSWVNLDYETVCCYTDQNDCEFHKNNGDTKENKLSKFFRENKK